MTNRPQHNPYEQPYVIINTIRYLKTTQKPQKHRGANCRVFAQQIQRKTIFTLISINYCRTTLQLS
jgi:hypothetical protein